jgi:hypothetical protein
VACDLLVLNYAPASHTHVLWEGRLVLRRVLIVVDTFLAVLFALSVIGILIVLSGSVMDLDILIFFVVLGVPYGLLRFVILGNPLPFTALPKSERSDV